MSIFRRRASRDTPEGAAPATDEPAESEESPTAVTGDADAAESAAPADPPFDRSTGPFDEAEVDGPDGRLDLGALWLSGVEGMELRLEIDQDQDAVVAATAVLGDSAVQLQAFAAPKSGGLWPEIRDEIAQSIVRGDGTAQLKTGPLGTELWTRMPSAGPGGRRTFTPARFTGVDGPRWFLRAVFSGRAATDDAAAGPLVEVVRSVVVVRGPSPMAPRELLPLTVPETDEEQVPEEVDERPGIDPFERGPEITEVR